MAIDCVIVPYDSGRRGYRMGAGPQSLLRAGLMQQLRTARHDIELVPVETGLQAEDELTVAFDLASRIERVVRASRAAHRFPLTLAGNCFSTLGAYAGATGNGGALLWLDAHGDVNTPETSGSGFLDGMSAATLLGWCHADRARVILPEPLAEARLLLVGTRDLDEAEGVALRASAVGALSPAEARDQAAAAAAVHALCADATAVYVHLDLDVLDADTVGRANGFASGGGLTQDDVVTLIRAAAARVPIAGMTVSAYDPAEDSGGAVARAAIGIIAAVLETADA